MKKRRVFGIPEEFNIMIKNTYFIFYKIRKINDYLI